MKTTARSHVVILCILLAVVVRSESGETNALASAYQSESQDLLRRYFAAWAKSSQPYSEAECATVPWWQRDACEMFTDFVIRKREASNTLYVVVQPSLLVTVGDWRTNQGKEEKHEVVPFRPRFSVTNVAALFLSNDREQTIVEFLNAATNLVHDAGDSSNVVYSERRRRLQFLSPYIHIIPRHWGGWHVVTHPYIDEIKLDSSSKSQAQINFRLGSSGGAAIYEKREGKWVMVALPPMWIE